MEEVLPVCILVIIYLKTGFFCTFCKFQDCHCSCSVTVSLFFLFVSVFSLSHNFISVMHNVLNKWAAIICLSQISYLFLRSMFLSNISNNKLCHWLIILATSLQHVAIIQRQINIDRGVCVTTCQYTLFSMLRYSTCVSVCLCEHLCSVFRTIWII